MTRVVVFAVLTVLTACGPRQPAPGSSAEPAPCTAPAGVLPADASATGLSGTYRLQLTAVRGARSGDSTSAEVELVPVADSLQTRPNTLGVRDTTVRYPLLGWTTIDPTAVGAVETGQLESHDPAAPGVLVIERQTQRPEARREILLRLGADANRGGRVRFDGGYFVLTVLRIGGGGFDGTWASAGGRQGAGGYFCARRAG
jgi:hypothetical protein